MQLTRAIFASPSAFISTERPVNPTLLFCPAELQRTAGTFLSGFPGLVTYAVKSNPEAMVIQNLDAAGLQGYDVASMAEVDLVCSIAPDAAQHFNNPVRSCSEIEAAVAAGVRSFSVDSLSELQKLAGIAPISETEVSVRFKLPVAGAAYDFGSKFGATPDVAEMLLKTARNFGFVPSITFHPGTQCTDAAAWIAYINRAKDIAKNASVEIARLNVGGGFPSHRLADEAPDLTPIFATIERTTRSAFGASRPALVCEPGRAMVAEAFCLLTQVRAVRDDGSVFLNDGVYGGLAESPLLGNIDRISVCRPDGSQRNGARAPRVVFGPTCDSVDRLPGTSALPTDIAEGDYVIFQGMGAYSSVTVTRFNGFGRLDIQTVLSLRD